MQTSAYNVHSCCSLQKYYTSTRIAYAVIHFRDIVSLLDILNICIVWSVILPRLTRMNYMLSNDLISII